MDSNNGRIIIPGREKIPDRMLGEPGPAPAGAVGAIQIGRTKKGLIVLAFTADEGRVFYTKENALQLAREIMRLANGFAV